MTNTKRKRSHKKKETTKSLEVDSKGKLSTSSPLRSTAHAGPKQKAVPRVGLEPIVKKATSVAVKPDKYQGEVHLNGTDVGTVVVSEDIKGMIAFCQGSAFSLAKLCPFVFINPSQGQVLTEFITPADWVAYAAVAILAAANDAKQLTSAYSGILNAFDKDCLVPLPIAEYIKRRLCVRGAPNVTRIINYATDLTISQGNILSPYVANELATNSFGTETNLSTFELNNYSIVAGSTDDYTSFVVPLTLNLIAPTSGRESWFQTRFAAVASYIAGLPIGKVRFGDIPKATTDYSGFSGPENGETWADAKRCLAPGKHNVDLAMYLNPNAVSQYYPGLSYQSGILPPTMAFQGGAYGNTFGGSGSYYGQPVVPANATRVAEVTGAFNHILLCADHQPRAFFGKHGYKYCGQPIPQLARIVNIPIDVAGLTAKLVQVILSETNAFSENSLNLPGGFLNAVAAVAQACIVRKILSAGQFEHLISLSPDVLSSTWNPQAMYPSLEYISSALPVGWNNILDAIGPVYFEGTMWVPSFGTTLPQQWATASGPAKYNLWSKFGFNSPSVNAYPPLAVPWAATNTNPDLYRHPYVYLANPTNSPTESYWYNPFAGVSDTTIFPDATPSVTSEVVSGEKIAPLLNYSSTYSYDSTDQTAYSNTFTSAGKEKNLVYQYAGVDAILLALTNIGKLNVKTARGYSIVPMQKYLGNRGMLAVNLATISNGNSRTLSSASFIVDDGTGNVATGLVVLSSFLENTVIQSNVFLTNAGIWMTAALGLNTQPVLAATRPAQLSAYTKAAYAVRLQDKESFSLWMQYANDLAADGSAVNTKVKKMLSAPKRMVDAENMITAVRVTEHEANAASTTALIDTAIGSEFTYGSRGLGVEELHKEAAVSRAIGVPTQEIAVVNSLEATKTLRSNDDSTASDFYNLGKGAWKGLKTIIPLGIDALKVGMMFV